ncbi:MAG: molybdenum cofactor guanylyltransferase [Terriglobales bacterium]
MIARMAVAAFVIAGGQSLRMGRDKALLRLDGQTLVERALGLAGGVSDHVSIVGPREKLHGIAELRSRGIMELNIVEDIFPGQGPLAGIHAALRSSEAELNLMIAVDTPFLDARFLRYLVEVAEKDGATVTVPVTEKRRKQPPINTDQHRSHINKSDQRSSVKISGPESSLQYQPLCAVYRREFAEVAERALRASRNNIVPLFREVRTRAIGDEELRQLAFDPRMFDNLNTPEEWDQARRRNAE